MSYSTGYLNENPGITIRGGHMENVRQHPMYQYLILLAVSSTVTMTCWMTLFNNFAVEMAGLDGDQVGIIQSVREIPGFLTFLVIYIIILVKEHHLASLSILVLGLGTAIMGFFPSFIGLLATTFLMSFGFHFYETANQSLTLQYFDDQVSPWVLGKITSAAAAATIGTGLFILLIMYFLSYSQTLLLMGGSMALVGAGAFFKDPSDRETIPQRKRMVFRKKYWLYYLLTFIAGARRQIYMTFGVFLMVKIFRFSVKEIAFLTALNSVVTYFTAPYVGKAIIRFGERRVLSVEYFSLIWVFLAYAFVERKLSLTFLYILDHVFFSFAMGIRTYFQKIGDPRDIAPSMAVGFTINHIAAVVLPALGGLLWMLDYRIPFLIGAGFSLISLIATQKMPSQENTDHRHRTE